MSGCWISNDYNQLISIILYPVHLCRIIVKYMRKAEEKLPQHVFKIEDYWVLLKPVSGCLEFKSAYLHL